MTVKTTEQWWHEFRASSAADVTMSLLRSRDALFHLAVMAAHLGDGQIVDGQTLAAEMNADLPELLHSSPHADTDDAATPAVTDADDLLTHWTKKGWVHRSVDPTSRTEQYQLTSGATQAVRQMRNLQRHTSIATESTLVIVMSELRQIAAEANPDPSARRASINEQIATLIAQRDALDNGETPRVNHTELVDKINTLTQLIERIPSDIARYGERMHANTATLLRQGLSGDPNEFAESLQRMFDGHDVIADSPEGQAFRSFSTMIGNPSHRAQLETDIAEITEHLPDLPTHLADSLNGFIDVMWNRVQEVEKTRGAAFRRISNFVRGGDFSHYRSMRIRINEVQASAAEAFARTHGGRDIGFVVPMSGVDARSVGRLRLDEGITTLPEPLNASDNDFDIDPAALTGQEAIDWQALQVAVHSAMDARNGFATLPEVLEQLPEPRTGDVIGLWSLATRHGDVDDTSGITVQTHTSRGSREITVPYLVFDQQLPDPQLGLDNRTPLRVRTSVTEGILDG
ncbi:Protein of unknown function [Actinopolyspora mzabensis]|uniref:DUF3375 domain-containing protein n=1 Tax=Actinopolyspora mzabensis TaxID=995066 RepID=A0A1G8ZXP0_ACTMZ|nr:DUF3375 domain-containing protein [Actinopolyspora mzabensis]SDK19886.1 Protein of unknown function [Actinopolyspora mzabensis]